MEGNNLILLIRKSPRKVVTMYQEYIADLVQQSRQQGENLLFVGINAGLLGSPVGKNMIDLSADYHVLLNVSTALNA